MAENYKHLYEQTKKMLTMYQDELIPGFRKKIEELEAKVATDNNVGSKWIPVTERLPEKAADYLCRCIVNNYDNMPFYMVLRYILVDTNPHFQHETKGGMKVTHWMPLPEPPKGE